MAYPLSRPDDFVPVQRFEAFFFGDCHGSVSSYPCSPSDKTSAHLCAQILFLWPKNLFTRSIHRLVRLPVLPSVWSTPPADSDMRCAVLRNRTSTLAIAARLTPNGSYFLFSRRRNRRKAPSRATPQSFNRRAVSVRCAAPIINARWVGRAIRGAATNPDSGFPSSRRLVKCQIRPN